MRLLSSLISVLVLSLMLVSVRARYLKDQTDRAEVKSNELTTYGKEERDLCAVPDLSNKLVTIKTHHSRYVSAPSDYTLTGSALNAEGNMAKFRVIAAGNGKYAFKTFHNRYVVAENDYSIRANRENLGSWERFTLEVIDACQKKFAIKTHKGRYVTAENYDRGFKMWADNVDIKAYEIFQINILEVDTGVEIYEHRNYEGSHSFINTGEKRDHYDLGIGNDQITSFKVKEGTRLEIWEHGGYTGDYRVFKGPYDESELRNGWNDRVSSLRVTPSNFRCDQAKEFRLKSLESRNVEDNGNNVEVRIEFEGESHGEDENCNPYLPGNCHHSMGKSQKWDIQEDWKKRLKPEALTIRVIEEDTHEWSDDDQYSTTISAGKWWLNSCDPLEVHVFIETEGEIKYSDCWSVGGSLTGNREDDEGSVGAELTGKFQRCSEYTYPARGFEAIIEVRSAV